jgi:SPP1 family holin
MMHNGASEAIVRLILLLVTGINLFLESRGYPAIDLDEGLITETVNGLFVLGYSVYVWWKNNNVTPQAQEAQKIIDEKKQK